MTHLTLSEHIEGEIVQNASRISLIPTMGYTPEKVLSGFARSIVQKILEEMPENRMELGVDFSRADDPSWVEGEEWNEALAAARAPLEEFLTK